jgi:hypothetical protein
MGSEVIVLFGIIALLLLPYMLTKILEKQIAVRYNLFPNDVFVTLVSNVGSAAFLIAAISDTIPELQLPIILGTLTIVIVYVLGKHKVPPILGVAYSVCNTASGVIFVFWWVVKTCYKTVFRMNLDDRRANTTRARNRAVELERQGKSEVDAAEQANREDVTSQLNSKKYDNPMESGPL